METRERQNIRIIFKTEDEKISADARLDIVTDVSASS